MESAERKFFPKSERLSLKNDIDNLFDKGQSFISYPLRIIYLPDSVESYTEAGISVLVSVPKRRIKRAVKRNRLKRLIRESFRLNKDTLANTRELNGKRLHIAFMYVCDDILPFADIEKAMLKALNKIRVFNSSTKNAIE